MPTNQNGKVMQKKVRSFFYSVWPITTLIATYFVFDSWLMRVSQLPEDAYREPCVTFQFLKHLRWQCVSLTAVCLMMIWRSWPKFLKWTDLGTWHLRAFITVLVTFMAWNFSTLDFNSYFGNWHVIDRILLVVCVPLVAFRPVAVFPFLMILVPFIFQFRHPDCLMYLLPEKYHPIHILVLFCAFFFLANIKKRAWPFYFVLLCLVAVHYWPSAVAKLRMNWLFDNELSNMLFSAHANGWLAVFDEDSIVNIYHVMRWLDFPLQLFTLLAEVAVIFILWNRKLSIGIAVSLAFMHVGILATSGICFLNWIVIDLGVLFLLLTVMRMEQEALFTKTNAVLSVVLIFFGSHWVQTSRFAWFDTHVCYTYRLSGIGVSGKTYPIAARTLAPYDFAFTWNLFEYLYPNKQLPIRYGNLRSPRMARRVRSIKSQEELIALEQEAGTTFFDKQSEQKYRRFLKTFFDDLNRRGKPTWIHWIQRPADLISSPPADAYRYEEPMRAVNVHRITTFFDGTIYREIRSEKLLTIEIPISRTASLSEWHLAPRGQSPRGARCHSRCCPTRLVGCSKSSSDLPEASENRADLQFYP